MRGDPARELEWLFITLNADLRLIKAYKFVL